MRRGRARAPPGPRQWILATVGVFVGMPLLKHARGKERAMGTRIDGCVDVTLLPVSLLSSILCCLLRGISAFSY